MLDDVISWNHKFMSIKNIIDMYPLELWYRVHPGKNTTNVKHADKISLVRPAYYKLKTKVKTINPKLVADVDAMHEKHKARRKLQKEMTNGKFGTIDSRFTSLGKRKK